MASLRKKYGRFWYLLFREGDRQRSIPLGPISASEARTIKIRFEADENYLRLDFAGKVKLKFSELAELYEAYARGFKAAITVKAEVEKLAVLSKTFGKRDIGTITTAELQDYLRPHGPNYQRLLIAALRSLFGLAILKKVLKVNPAKELRRPRIPKAPPRAVDQASIKAVFAAMTPATWAKWMVAYHAGLRPSELKALQVGQVDFKAGVITILKTKTGDFRRIPIHRNIEKILKDVCAGRGREEFLFPGRWGDAAIELRQGLKDACIAAKVKGVTPYTFRHQFATDILNQPVQAGMTYDQVLTGLKEILGHSTLEMTLRYARVLPPTVRAVMDNFAGIPGENQKSPPPAL
jgi:integrase